MWDMFDTGVVRPLRPLRRADMLACQWQWSLARCCAPRRVEAKARRSTKILLRNHGGLVALSCWDFATVALHAFGPSQGGTFDGSVAATECQPVELLAGEGLGSVGSRAGDGARPYRTVGPRLQLASPG